MNTFSNRLREERKRLGLDQEEFARLGGVNRITQSGYETGKRSPDAVYLQQVAAAGVDVGYVLTGVRGVQDLSSDEMSLLNNYRICPEEGRRAVQATSMALAQLVGSIIATNGRARNGMDSRSSVF